MISRRSFLEGIAAAGTFSVLGKEEAEAADSPKFGICTGVGNAPLLKSIGYKFIECNASGIFEADKSDTEWGPMSAKLKASALPILSCNGFLPGKFRLTGDEARQDEALKYAVTECRRADQLGIPVLVFGSGSARNAPKGYCIEKAKAQFVEFCKKLGAAIADCRVTVILEPLQAKEANFLNLVAEGIEMVDEIKSPRIQLHADLFHMHMGGETPEVIRKGGARIRHCHLASWDRQWPGEKPDDFRPFFKAFRDIGYKGVYSCECGWGKDPQKGTYAKALAYLKEQSKS